MKNILVIAPHADDEVLGVGGTVNKFLNEGNQVHLIVCSRRKNDLPEYTDATEIYTSVCYMNYSDEGLSAVSNYLLKNIEKVYNDIKPDIVFIPNKDDFNLDHKVVHELCEIVVRRYQENPPRMVLMYEVPSSTTQSFNNNFKCNYYIPLTKKDITAKLAIFNKYTNEIRQYPNPRSPKGIEVYASFRGMECGELFAEGFNLLYGKI